MRIYKCLITGDELFTDAKKVEEVDGFYRVKGKQCSRSNAIDDSLIGGNASQEDPSEGGADDSDVHGIDLVVDNGYIESGFGKKKEYLIYMKDYLKALQDKLNIAAGSDEEAQFRSDIKVPFSKAQEWFKDLQFFSGKSMEENGLIALCRYEAPEEGGDEDPIFYYYKIGVISEKV